MGSTVSKNKVKVMAGPPTVLVLQRHFEAMHLRAVPAVEDFAEHLKTCGRLYSVSQVRRALAAVAPKIKEEVHSVAHGLKHLLSEHALRRADLSYEEREVARSFFLNSTRFHLPSERTPETHFLLERGYTRARSELALLPRFNQVNEALQEVEREWNTSLRSRNFKGKAVLQEAVHLLSALRQEVETLSSIKRAT